MADEVDVAARERSETAARVVLPVVAIGASAGGLTPTSEVLEGLGAHPGVAVVVVHHLDPTHASGLVEILSRATELPVVAASDGVRVEADHVYVVQPNEALLMEAGVLRVVARRGEEGGLHLPIDRFFESLAADRSVFAIGVVLSGSGSDGTAGVQAIKAEGGVAFAHDATAAHASMPESAFATGCIDAVLGPAAIAREIRRIGATAPPFLVASAPPAEPAYAQILALVRKTNGVDFSSYKPTTVRRRLVRRLLLKGLLGVPEYLALLQREPEEIEAFTEDVLIHVTAFFREPAAFEALASSVFPKLCESRPGDAPLRVWVPACSTGEEVYSIAMRLLEFLEHTRQDDLPLRIFGTDLSLVTIEKARAGRYPRSIEQDVSPGRLQRFFTLDDGEYQIRREVRDLCVFAKHDVAHDPPFSAMDLISCRNLMIYLGPELQERVIALLHYALKEPGFLLLGSVETVSAFAGFTTVDSANKLYARTSAAPRLTFDFTTPRLWMDPHGANRAGIGAPPTRSGAGATSQPEISREADRLVLAKFAPAGVVVTSDLAILQFRGQTGPFLEPTPGVATLDLFRLAREELRLPLRRAIDEARAKQAPAREDGVALTVGEARRTLSIEVLPFAMHALQQRLFLILFEDTTATDPPREPRAPALVESTERPEADAQLKLELVSTRQYLESVIEQLEATNEELKAANEEIVSSNEELRSTNEELQSAKEELQAANEELRTVNEEMNERNIRSVRINDDLINVLASVEIPIVILGRDSRIRRYTPAASRVLGIHPGDLKRPIGELPVIAAMVPSLARMISEVLSQLRPAECVAQDDAGRWYDVSVRPYLTLDGRIDGTVIVALDVDALTRSGDRLADARKYAESVVDTVREGLVVLDREYRVCSTNKAFQRMFRVASSDIDGRPLDELGRPELAAPALRARLMALGKAGAVDDLRIESAEGEGEGTSGARAFAVTARPIDGTPRVLVAFEDVTEAERSASAARRVELGFREVLGEASEAIFMVGEAGQVLFANHAAATTFGYERGELVGLAVEVLLPERDRDAYDAYRVDYLRAPSPSVVSRRQLLARRKDGSEVPVELTLDSMKGEAGRIFVAFVSDVTQRREDERKIRDYQDRLERMAFDAALSEERERRRIAVDLHDRIGQSLALAQIKLTSAREALSGPPRADVDAVIALLEQSAVETRTLTFELSPPVLYDLGLKEALSWLAEEVERRYGIRVEVADDGVEKPLDDTTRALVFRAVRELLMNVFKHAKVHNARVTLQRADDHFDIAVEDSGVGFEKGAGVERATGGFGLFSVREQIRRLGGTLEIDSAVDRGTRVTMRLPLTPPSSRSLNQGANS